MKNLFAYDFTNRTIVATKATLKKASNPTTDEYTALIKMIEGQPTFRVVEKTIKNSGNKKTYKGLTLKMMMDYTADTIFDKMRANVSNLYSSVYFFSYISSCFNRTLVFNFIQVPRPHFSSIVEF